MKKPSERDDERAQIENLIGLGQASARKSYYPELLRKIEELEREKDRYKWLFEHALHGIFQAAASGPLNAANPALAKICAYPSEGTLLTAIRDYPSELFYQADDCRQMLETLYRDGACMGFETRLRRRDGSAVQVSLNVILKDPERGLFEAFVADITDRKRAQLALKKLNEELEQRVQSRTSELSDVNRKLRQEIQERKEIERALVAAKQEAEQANLSKDKYLAAASHDLLQPLNAARLSIATLLERTLGDRDHQLVERTHIALCGAEALLADLLDISKLDAQAVTPDLCDFAVADLLHALASEFQPVAKNAGLSLCTRSSRLLIRSDLRLLMRILRNFVSNAIRYTEQGRILVGCRRQGACLRLEVWDTGPGIPASHLDDIFAEFQQLDNSIQGRDKGVGLGLAIVERIARVLHHPLRVVSRLGQGSCFSVSVPLAATAHLAHKQPAADLAAAPACNDALAGLRVLVIDNETAILDSMQALLETWRCQVATACDLEEAVAAVQASMPDIVLADYHLARGRTGLEAVQAIRQACGHAIPAIMITADRSDALRQAFSKAGLTKLNKPVKPGKLRALLSHYRAQTRP